MKVELVQRAEEAKEKAVKLAIANKDIMEWEKSEVLHWFVAVKRRKFPLLLVPRPYIYDVAHLLHTEEQQDERNYAAPAAISALAAAVANPS